jgi:hypothetical protein
VGLGYENVALIQNCVIPTVEGLLGHAAILPLWDLLASFDYLEFVRIDKTESHFC